MLKDRNQSKPNGKRPSLVEKQILNSNKSKREKDEKELEQPVQGLDKMKVKKMSEQQIKAAEERRAKIKE